MTVLPVTIDSDWFARSAVFEPVRRRIDCPWPPLETALTASGVFAAGTRWSLPRGTVLRIDTAFTATRSGPLPGCQAQARLSADAAHVFDSRIAIDVVAWSETQSELLVRPTARRFAQWGARRQRDYFVCAHDAADLLARLARAASPLT
ncbi:MAG: hypothetical protein JOZ99_02460 [Actinobacteria bacterium]|nr:hypothetical protein [Actinomycetota bacterium]